MTEESKELEDLEIIDPDELCNAIEEYFKSEQGKIKELEKRIAFLEKHQEVKDD